MGRGAGGGGRRRTPGPCDAGAFPGHVLGAHLARTHRRFHRRCVVITEGRGAPPREPWAPPAASRVPRRPPPHAPRIDAVGAPLVGRQTRSLVHTRSACPHAIRRRDVPRGARDVQTRGRVWAPRLSGDRHDRSSTCDSAAGRPSWCVRRADTRSRVCGDKRGGDLVGSGERGADERGSSGRTQGSRGGAPSSVRCGETGSVKAPWSSREMGRRARVLGGPASQGPTARRPPPRPRSPCPALLTHARVARTSQRASDQVCATASISTLKLKGKRDTSTQVRAGTRGPGKNLP